MLTQDHALDAATETDIVYGWLDRQDPETVLRSLFAVLDEWIDQSDGLVHVGAALIESFQRLLEHLGDPLPDTC